MQERLRGVWSNLLERWNGLDKTQKTRLMMTVFVVALVLVAMVYFITRPNMVELARDISFSDASAITNALNENGIRNNVGRGGGTVFVRERDYNQARMLLADRNLPNDAGFTWADALDASGMTATETIKRENLRRAHESDLAQRLTIFEGVDSAVVFLALPDDDLFFLPNLNRQASVSVTLTTSMPISQTQALSIARFISRSVVGLTMDNIEIVNQNMETLFSGQSGISGGITETNLDRAIQREIESGIRFAILPLFNDVRIVSNIRINMNEVQEISNLLRSPTGEENATGVVIEEITHRATAENRPITGEPGLGSNAATGPGYQMPGAGQSSAQEQSSEIRFGYDEIQRIVREGGGELLTDDSSISVFVFRHRVYDQEHLTRNDMLEGMEWEDFRQANSFPLLIPMEAGGTLEALQDMLRTGTGIDSIVLSAFEIPMFIDYEPSTIPLNQIIMFGILVLLIGLLAIALIRRAQGETVEDIEPELAVEDLIVSDKLEQEKEEAMRLRDIEFAQESETRVQIEKFIQDKPEAAAALLRNWLSEDWE
ncbi:MAG: hypothetical protein FWE29_03660 [Defluviitaleaceae bacterium]|nr:hypothetical protein [Defluviitaleaceae bacterium]